MYPSYKYVDEELGRNCGDASGDKGRHLESTQRINRHDVIFMERPLLSLQSMGNAHSGALCCRCCRCYIGGPYTCLELTSGNASRKDIYNHWGRLQRLYAKEQGSTTSNWEPGHCWDVRGCNSLEGDDSTDIVPCRNSCGELFCSKRCEVETWECHGHQLLCTGWIPDACNNAGGNNENHSDNANVDDVVNKSSIGERDKEKRDLNDNPASNPRAEGEEQAEGGNGRELNSSVASASSHPLLDFKIHAIQCNEIFLMVADLIATILSLRAKELLNDQQSNRHDDIAAHTTNDSMNRKEAQPSPLSKILRPYVDFTMIPWWTVATTPLLSTPMVFAEVSKLDETLRSLCDDSANLLRDALYAVISFTHDDNNHNKEIDVSTAPLLPPSYSHLLKAFQECDEELKLFTGDFFGRVIGSFEQNAIGIHCRHPVARDVLANRTLRANAHDTLVKCIGKAGMMGDADVEEEFTSQQGELHFDDGKVRVTNTTVEHTNCGEKQSVVCRSPCNDQLLDQQEEHADCYTVNDIAEFLCKLVIHDDNCASNIASSDHGESKFDNVDDDLDQLFPPLDGIAMFSIACKMNHSCEPNVLVRYRAGWGRDRPLILQAIATRDIEIGEELCISYISCEETLEDRRKSLQNYGFICNCRKCVNESKTVGDETSNLVNPMQENTAVDVFGDDESDCESFGQTDDFENLDKLSSDGVREILFTSVENQTEKMLQSRSTELFCSSSTMPGRLPKQVVATTSSNVLRQAADAICDLLKFTDECALGMIQCLQLCIEALKKCNYYSALLAGRDGETVATYVLISNGSWPHNAWREAYGCCVTSAAIGYANNCDVIDALRMLDKGCIMGLSICHVTNLKNYLEHHGGAYRGRYIIDACLLPDYRKSEFASLLEQSSLVRVISNGIDECECGSISGFVSLGRPVVARGYADEWPAIQKWRDIGKLAWKYSFRLVPIEIGSMCGPNKMKERLLRFSDFFDNFLKSSCEHGLWSSDDAGICTVVHNERREYSTIRWVAYVAQHQLFDQLPNLLRDVGRLPTTSDINCPNLRRNVWIGTGGTRTPLHFDSSDNFFVQIAGSKYIRLYGTDQTDKLYVIIHAGEGYAKQQNMSAVNCEREDFLKHPKAADAKYMEAILLPGDLIFIPQGVWHYVRALTTSISVNFWF